MQQMVSTIKENLVMENITMENHIRSLLISGKEKIRVEDQLMLKIKMVSI